MNLLAVVDFVGVIGFVFALIYGWRNYLRTRVESKLWLVYSLASAAGVLWALTTLLNVIGYVEGLAELILPVATLYMVFSITAHESWVT